MARQALQAGDRQRAQRLLSQALSDGRLDAARQADAWLLLAAVVDQPDRRRYCLERSLALRPEHAAARKAYQALSGQALAAGVNAAPTAAGGEIPSPAAEAGAAQAAAPETAAFSASSVSVAAAAERAQPATASPVNIAPVSGPAPVDIATAVSQATAAAPPAARRPPRRGRRSCLLWLTALAALAVIALLAALIQPGVFGFSEAGLAGPILLEPNAWGQLFGSLDPAAEPRHTAPPGAAGLPTLGLPRPPTWTPTASPLPTTPATPRPTLNLIGANATPLASITPFWGEWDLVIGKSVQGRPLEVVRFGTGAKERMIIAGIHGGDEWNTIALADEIIAHVRRRPGLVPPGYTLYILRALNPDGEARDHSPKGRYNANGVDLNRNFDTNWKSVWRSNGCSSEPGTAGSGPGSEPETQALKAFLAERHVEVLINYHSAGLGVFPSGDPAHPGSVRLAQSIAAISDYVYPPVKTGCEYTGTLVDWAADHGVAAAVDLELNSLNETEFDANRKILELLMTFDPEQ